MTDRASRRSTGLLVAVALVAGLAAGCAPTTPGGETPVPGTSQGPSPTPGQRPTPTTTPTPVPTAIAPTSPGASPSATLTVTGTVEPGVEAGCLVLTADGVTYLLLGARTLVRAGDRVTVDGVLETDVATTCQQGTPLRVTDVRPA